MDFQTWSKFCCHFCHLCQCASLQSLVGNSTRVQKTQMPSKWLHAVHIFLDISSLIWLFMSTMTKKSKENGKLCVVDAQVRVCVLLVLKNKTSNNSVFGSCHGTAMLNGGVK